MSGGLQRPCGVLTSLALWALIAPAVASESAPPAPVSPAQAPAATAAPGPVDAGAAVRVVAPANRLVLEQCDEIVRPPCVFRLRLSRVVAQDERLRGPMALEVSLAQGQSLLASDFITLPHLGMLGDGVTVALAPGALASQGSAPARLRVTLLDGDAPIAGAPLRPLESITRTLTTPPTLAADLDNVQRLLGHGGAQPALVRLWAEQAEEITQGQPSLERCHELQRLLALLHGALGPGARAPDSDGPLEAYRDPTDGSVQPERRYHPARDRGGEAWLLSSGERDPLKSDWPEPDERILLGSAQAGCLLVQEYPAGDARWEGIALLRASRRLQKTAQGRVLLIGAGRAAIAALCLAALEPQRIAAVRLVDPVFGQDGPPPLPGSIPVTISGLADPAAAAWGADRPRLPPPQDPAFWQLSPAPRSPPQALPLALVAPELASPLARYGLGPFVVVVGTDEHAAAQADNRDLAHRFLGAWASHAQGLPPCIDDSDFDPRAYRGYAWVLIGNPRSNRVIRRLARRHPLPITWDSRCLTLDGVSYLRAQRRAVAVEVQRADGGTAVVLDGAPAWSAPGLPLVGLRSPSVGAPTVPMASPSATPNAPMMARP